MTRNGKIARLPRHIRIELNQRLDDGEQGTNLIKWLNNLEETEQILARDFDNRPISEQNLSEWKQGGFLDWQRQQQISDQVHQLVELSDDLTSALEHSSAANRLAIILAANLAAETSRLLTETTDPKDRMRIICEALRHLGALRRGDNAAAREARKSERWRIKCEKRERKEQDAIAAEMREIVQAPINEAMKRPALILGFGGGKAGEQAADLVIKTDRDYRIATSSIPEAWKAAYPPSNPPKIKPDQTKSNQIKPNKAP